MNGAKSGPALMVQSRDTDLRLLTDPNQYQEPIDISDQDPNHLVDCLRKMILIRKAEEKIGDMVTAGIIAGPAHLGIGQEAIAVGVTSQTRPGDRIFGTHRSHSHFLALGNAVYSLFAEIIGKVAGCSKGMGGSMHLFGRATGMFASVPIVAATIPIAVGAALAAKMDAAGDVSISYFGDGALEEGACQESLNLASVMGLPVIFVCENNLFASHMHIRLRQPSNSTARYAQAHNIPSHVVDGNDLVAVMKSVEAAVQRARAGEGPSYIEAITYRWRGHVGPREDMDVGLKRSEDLVIWKKRDPISRLSLSLIATSIISEKYLADIQEEVQAAVDKAWKRAMESPYPDPSMLLDLVYSSSGN